MQQTADVDVAKEEITEITIPVSGLFYFCYAAVATDSVDAETVVVAMTAA